MKISHAIIAATVVMALVACKGGTDAVSADTTVPADTTAEMQQESSPVLPVTTTDNYFSRKAKEPVRTTARPAARPMARPAVSPAPKPADNDAAETIYVETDGAQGRVWGHVTMHGDRGTGTIHDWDENTLTVNVTRHGNELFAVDQNSRQYVFKLKK